MMEATMAAFTFTIKRGADRAAMQKSRVGPRSKLNFVEFVVGEDTRYPIVSRTLTNVYDVRVERIVAEGGVLQISGIAFTLHGERPCRIYDYDPAKGTGTMVIYD